MDLFREKNIAPMLISQMQEPFDSSDWIYELKLDGCRCVAYLEEGKVILRNKRNLELLPRFPELSDIHRQAKQKCILDGELVVLVKGVPDFYELQKRTLLTNRVKIKLGAERLPASFVAYDCLQYGEKVLFDVPLMERKHVLQDLVREAERIAVSRYIQEKGIDLFNLTVQKELEGVVAKAGYYSYTESRSMPVFSYPKWKRACDMV